MQVADTIRTRRSFTPVVWIGALMSAGVAAYSYRYVIATGFVPPIIVQNGFRYPWLMIHVLSAATALLIAPVQFSSRIRRIAPSVHRWTGRIYVVGCLLGGVSGLFLAFGASTGSVSSLGFGTLAIAWLVCTGLAWWAAVERRFADHRAWMIRSFALTFAAVTLRIYIPILLSLPVPFATGYPFISFACWVPNIIVAEAFLRSGFRMRRL